MGQSGSPAAGPPAPQAGLPRGKIGKLEISRLILGGNLLTHFTHSRDLRYVYSLAARYNTDEKILETLATAEAHGINAVTMHNPPHPMSLLRRYRKERGGKIQWIICPTAAVEPGLAEYRQHVEELIKDGCEAIYLWGVHADALVAQGKIDLVAEAVELPKKYGVPSGVGGHALDVVQACERHGVKADFYIKTFHSHSYPTAPKPEQITGPLNEFPGYWCSNPQETADFMKGVAEAVDRLQDDGGGRDSAAAGLPPGVRQRRRLRAGRHVRLRDCRRRANRPGGGGCPSRSRAALAGLSHCRRNLDRARLQFRAGYNQREKTRGLWQAGGVRYTYRRANCRDRFA